MWEPANFEIITPFSSAAAQGSERCFIMLQKEPDDSGENRKHFNSPTTAWLTPTRFVQRRMVKCEICLHTTPTRFYSYILHTKSPHEIPVYVLQMGKTSHWPTWVTAGLRPNMWTLMSQRPMKCLLIANMQIHSLTTTESPLLWFACIEFAQPLDVETMRRFKPFTQSPQVV